jgi:2-C-methyl-D-erythritol 4-phosphate cytidylyltransferase
VSQFQFALIIPAAGSGKRIGGDIAKPFLKIAGKSILGHTVSRFANINGLSQVLVATSPGYFKEAELAGKWLPEKVSFQVIEGGSERQYSIYNALQEIDKSVDLIAIHDAVRPFVSVESVARCLDQANLSGAAILGVPVKDTIKKVDTNGRIIETPERGALWQAQTPQIFRRDIIINAFDKALKEKYLGTDDASLVEYFGGDVTVVKGERQNFKITYPLDLRLAELLING